MAKDFLEMITELLLAKKLGEELQKDKQYKIDIAKEKHLYELLNNHLHLNEEQQTIFKTNFDSINTTSSFVKNFVYKQGMTDLLSLFMSLSVNKSVNS